MDEDSIAILTLPYSNDLTSVYSQTNNIVTLIVICFELVLMVTLVILSYIISTVIHNDIKVKSSFVNSDSVLCYINICVWLLVLVIKLYLKRYYYKRLRVVGYHKHHKKVSWIADVPSLVLHIANAALLVVLAVFHKYESSEITLSAAVTLKAELLLQIVITSAVVVILPFLCVQLYHEVKFRRERKPPDVFCIDDPQHLQQAGLSEVGLRSSTYLEDLLEKQADLIGNLKLQNGHLRMMLFKLFQNRGSSSDMTSSSVH